MMIREEEMKGKGQKNLDSIFRSQSLCCEVGKSRHVRDTFCFNEHREIAIYFEKQCIDYMEMTSIKISVYQSWKSPATVCVLSYSTCFPHLKEQNRGDRRRKVGFGEL